MLCFKSGFILSPNACQTVPTNPNVSLKPRWHQRNCGFNGMSIAFNIHRKAMPVGADAVAGIYEAMDCYIKRNVRPCRRFEPRDQFISCHDNSPSWSATRIRIIAVTVAENSPHLPHLK